MNSLIEIMVNAGKRRDTAYFRNMFTVAKYGVLEENSPILQMIQVWDRPTVEWVAGELWAVLHEHDDGREEKK